MKIAFKGIQLDTKIGKSTIRKSFQTVFYRLLEKFTQKDVKVLITIDEVRTTPLLKKLISCYQIMLRDNLSVALLMAGLPGNVSEIQNDDVLTFLLRANRITLNPLDVESIKTSYARIFRNAGYQVEAPTLLYMTKQTMGFAYAFQLLGYLVWQTSEEQASKQITIDTIKNVLDTYVSELFRNVYHKVYHEMSMREREFVQAMVKSGQEKVKAQQISQAMDKQPGYVSVYRRKLIDDQIIAPAGYGYVHFMLPYFGQYVEEQLIMDQF